MNKLAFIIIFLLLFVAGIATFFLPASDIEKNKSDTLLIATSLYPVFDIVRNIAGEHAEVFVLLPPGASPHTFEVTPTQAKLMQQTDILFEIGIIDEWTRPLLAANETVRVISFANHVETLPFRGLGEHEDDHDDLGENDLGQVIDPHYWLSIMNAKHMASRVYEELVQEDPVNVAGYRDNLEVYLEKLDDLEVEIRAVLAPVAGSKIISFHDSWQYLEKEYGIETVAVVQTSAGVEPLPNDIKEVYDLIKKFNITAIFSEPQLSRMQVKSFIDDLGLTEYVLDPIGGVGGRSSYISLMRYNAGIIKDALEN